MSRRRKKSTLYILCELLVVFAKLFLLILKACAWIVFAFLPGIVYLIWSAWGYSKSEYKEITHNSIFTTYCDKGKRGEYFIYRHLKGKCEGARWLFNLYLPREDGRTTEIDVMMIHSSGIYVFESKNYKGWIYGSAHREKWTQCIKPAERARTKKYHFLNPLIQNQIHIKYLKLLLPIEIHNYIYPIVVFGNKCKLKNIELVSTDQVVLHMKSIGKEFQEEFLSQVLDEASIEAIYSDLYQYTQVSEEIKNKHIMDINAIIEADNATAGDDI